MWAELRCAVCGQGRRPAGRCQQPPPPPTPAPPERHVASPSAHKRQRASAPKKSSEKQPAKAAKKSNKSAVEKRQPTGAGDATGPSVEPWATLWPRLEKQGWVKLSEPRKTTGSGRSNDHYYLPPGVVRGQPGCVLRSVLCLLAPSRFPGCQLFFSVRSACSVCLPNCLARISPV